MNFVLLKSTFWTSPSNFTFLKVVELKRYQLTPEHFWNTPPSQIWWDRNGIHSYSHFPISKHQVSVTTVLATGIWNSVLSKLVSSPNLPPIHYQMLKTQESFLIPFFPSFYYIQSVRNCWAYCQYIHWQLLFSLLSSLSHSQTHWHPSVWQHLFVTLETFHMKGETVDLSCVHQSSWPWSASLWQEGTLPVLFLLTLPLYICLN